MNTMVLASANPFVLSLPRQDNSRGLVRGAALVTALAAHALLFLSSGPEPQPVAPPAVETLEVSVVAQGDATNDRAAETQSAAEMAPPPEPEPVPEQPEPEPPPAVEEAPVKEDPTAIAIPVRKPEPPKVEKPPEPRKPPEPHPKPKPKPQPKAPPKAETPSAASAAQHRGHAGAERGAQADASKALADYGAKLKAEINRHKAYPAAARNRHAAGIALVTFMVGPSGHVASASIARSSGDSDLDQAALQAVRGSSLPPPPGGHFGGRIAVDFSLKH
ncbi:MAG: energy transducer TonB [Microvirga sp.]